MRQVRPARAPRINATLDAIPILVLGCHRSGTSLLRRCLNSHSRIACPAETLFLESFSATLDYPSAELGFEGIGMTREQAAGDLRELADRWLRAHAARQGKPRWADKSPGVLAHLDGLGRLYPTSGSARFVAIVRDGMDVATSLGRTEPPWWQLDPFVRPGESARFVAAARYWADRNGKLRAFLDARADDAHLVRYEDLIREPATTLRGIFAFLGEAFEPEVLDFNGHAHGAGLEDHHVSTTTRFEDNTGKHRKLPQPTQVRMWDEVRAVMRSFGYADRTYAAIREPVNSGIEA